MKPKNFRSNWLIEKKKKDRDSLISKTYLTKIKYHHLSKNYDESQKIIQTTQYLVISFFKMHHQYPRIQIVIINPMISSLDCNKASQLLGRLVNKKTQYLNLKSKTLLKMNKLFTKMVILWLKVKS